MKQLTIFFIWFLSLNLVACNTVPQNLQIAGMPSQEQSMFYAGQIDGDNAWETCFQEQGATRIWEELRKNELQVSIDLNELKNLNGFMPDQANQVTADIIQYLIACNPEVTTLYLMGSELATRKKISSLPPAISKLANLQFLDLSNNKLTDLPPALAQLNNLHSIILKENQIKELPLVITQLLQLRWLDLSNNLLEKVPSSIANLVNLLHLGLGHNQFKNLSSVIGDLPSLGWLYLNDNQLAELPPAISNLKKLVCLNVENNFLTMLPSNLEKSTISKKLAGNPWMQCSDCQNHAITPIELATHVNQSLPRSLFAICGSDVQGIINKATPEKRKKILEKLPIDLQPKPLAEKLQQKSFLFEHQRLIYFKNIGNQAIPFYWKGKIVTRRDAKNMLTNLSGRTLYLIPESN